MEIDSITEIIEPYKDIKLVCNPKGLHFFLLFGFENYKLILYISNIEKIPPPIITKISMALGLLMVN